MHYDQVIDGCLAVSIGESGLTEEELAPFLEEASQIIRDLKSGTADSTEAILALPRRRDDIESIDLLADELRSRFDSFVVLGTGGSSLGGRAITHLAATEAPHSIRDLPNFRFIDNLDPNSMTLLQREMGLDRTACLVISKSGATSETVAQYLVCCDAVVNEFGENEAASRFVVITDPKDSPLRRIAVARGHIVLDHDREIGGRYSVLSMVGMLPAAIVGLKPAATRNGAVSVLDRAFESNDADPSPSAMGAAVSIGLMQHRGVNMSVLMPYGDVLEPFAAWYRQLWAESLGKDGIGSTPVSALGPVDQHSQLQLYLDGPRDKMFTIIQSPVEGTGPAIPLPLVEDTELGYLSGLTVGDIVAAQQRATTEVLMRRRCPTRIIRLDRLDEEVLGALFMHFMLETIIAARMLGVDPFGQPAVDEGKALTRELLRKNI